MLVSKKLEVGDVAVIRLTTGEEVVARLVSFDTPGGLVITKPVQLQIHLDPSNGQIAGIGFVPFMVGTPEDGNFLIRSNAILVDPMKPRPDIETNYINATGSIVVPKKGLIV